MIDIELKMTAPFTVKHHSDYPKCGVSYVMSSEGMEVCTVYASPSYLIAQTLADGLNEAYGPKSPPEGPTL